MNFEKDKTRVYASACYTGMCDDMDYVNGRLGVNEYSISFLYRGIENIYGNVWEFMDGVAYSANSTYININGKIGGAHV